MAFEAAPGSGPYPGADPNAAPGSGPFPGADPNAAPGSGPYPGADPNAAPGAGPFPGADPNAAPGAGPDGLPLRPSPMPDPVSDPEGYRRFLQGLPEVQAANYAAARAVDSRVEARLREDLRQIRQLDHSVQRLEDLRDRPNYDTIVSMVRRGLTLPEAFKLANFQSLTEAAAAKEKQSTLNRLRGKTHLQPVTGMQGQGAVPVPRDVLAQYRLFNGNASDEEILRHYNTEQTRRR